MVCNVIVNVPLGIELFHRHATSIKNNYDRNNSERIISNVTELG